MTDPQVGALITAGTLLAGGLGTFLRWAVRQIVKSSDETRAALKESTATVAVNTEVTRKFSTDVRQLFSRLDDQADAVEDLKRELTPVFGVPVQEEPQPRRTPPSGYSVVRRPGTRGGDR